MIIIKNYIFCIIGILEIIKILIVAKREMIEWTWVNIAWNTATYRNNS